MHESGVHPRCADTFVSQETEVSEDATSKGERGAQDRRPRVPVLFFLNYGTPLTRPHIRATSFKCSTSTVRLINSSFTADSSIANAGMNIDMMGSKPPRPVRATSKDFLFLGIEDREKAGEVGEIRVW